MKKNIIEDLFWGPIFILLGGLAEIFALSLLLKTPLTWAFILIIVLTPGILYLFDFLEDKTDNDNLVQESAILNRTQKKLYKFGNFNTLFIFLILLVMGILYPLFFKKITKKITGFKDIYVAISWNLFVVFYFAYYKIEIIPFVALLLFFIFTRDLVNASFCDLKDIEKDKTNNLLTFANVWGEKKLINFLQYINVLSIIILILGFFFFNAPASILLLIIPVVITFFFISKSFKSRHYYSWIVDIEYFIWAITFFIGLKLF